jgi:cobalt/nickel transport system permease protein
VSCVTYIEGSSVVHRLDPRVKVVAGFAFSLLIALSQSFAVLWSGLFCAILLAAIARLPLGALLKRLLGLNVFMVLLWLTLPVTTPGAVLVSIGPLELTREGIFLSAAITLKGNAIVIFYTALLSTIELVTLGHALSHLHVPAKLAHLLLFTIRYVDVLHHEYARLRTAMKTRCFRARANAHTYRTFAYLAAMLLTRSLDRSERIIAAMKCRGFSGKFYLMFHFRMMRRDAVFIAISLALLSMFLWTELL